MSTTFRDDVIADMFPEGLKVPVRTGRKNEQGQHIAVLLECELDNWTPEVIALAISKGVRAFAAENLNNCPTKDGVKLEAMRKLINAANAGEFPLALERAKRGQGVGTDPVLVQAIKLAVADIMAIGKVTTKLKAADSPTIGKFFKVSASGSVSDNVDAIIKFIDANDAKREYTKRAQEIVDATKTASEELADIQL